MSEHNEIEKQKEPAYNYRLYVLNMNREKLYERINKRVDIMLENGLVNEVKCLLEKYSPDLVSMQGLGYKEFVPYFNGTTTLDEAVENLKKSTRHFAKRQLTWFKHQSKDAVWIDMDKMNSVEAAKFISDDFSNLL
jgi:tRNA dimethylallyltransferase